MDWILFSPVDWAGPIGRPHAIAQVLAQAHDLLWVNPPPSFLRRPSFGLHMEQTKGRITVLDLPGGIPGRRNRWIDQLNQKRWLRVLQRHLPQIHHPKQPLGVMLETPFAHTMAFGLHAELVVYDAWEDWSQVAAVTAPNVAKVEAVLARQAQLILVPNEESKRRFDRTEAIPRLLPGGCTLMPSLEQVTPMGILTKKDGPHFLYIGPVDDCFDVDLLRAATSALPDARWWILGPLIGKDAQKLRKSKNVRVYESVPASDLPRWFAGADACILPIFNSIWARNRDWPQFYQYMASGLPVISAALPVVEEYSDLIEIAHPELMRGFSDACVRALKNDTVALRARRREVAVDMTWEKRVQTLLGYVGRQLPTRVMRRDPNTIV